MTIGLEAGDLDTNRDEQSWQKVAKIPNCGSRMVLRTQNVFFLAAWPRLAWPHC